MRKRDALGLLPLAEMHYTLFPEEHALLYDFIVKHKADLHPGEIIMELGVCYGRTSLILAYIAKHLGMEYHGVDCFVFDGSEEKFQAAMDGSGLPYTLHRGMTTSVGSVHGLSEVPWDQPIAILFIDASHNEPWFPADCERWLPFVRPGGLVFFDDWADPKPHRGRRQPPLGSRSLRRAIHPRLGRSGLDRAPITHQEKTQIW